MPAIAATVFLALGTCTVMTGVLQRRAMADFVDEVPLVLEPLESSGAAVEHAGTTLARIGSAAASDDAAEIEVTVADLNAWIDKEPLLESLRETARVRGIGPDGLVMEMSQELRGPRYLNGRFRFSVARSGTNTWQLILEDIEVPGREVPPAFLRMYRDLHMFRFDAGNKELQAVLKRIDGIRLEEGSAVVSFSARE